jgi:hypothetical protein
MTRFRVKGLIDSLKIPSLVSGQDSKSQYSSHYYLIKVRQRDMDCEADNKSTSMPKYSLDSRLFFRKSKTIGYKDFDLIWTADRNNTTADLVHCTQVQSKISNLIKYFPRGHARIYGGLTKEN